MEFLRHTREALNEYVSLTEPDLEGSLMTMGGSAARIVPECVGLALTLFDEGLTFALVAPALAGAALEPGQPREDAPPLAGERGDLSAQAAGDLMDEDRWALMARSQSAEGVASSLTMPVIDHGRVVGGINLYASAADAFSGHHRELAFALGASADGAVTNADLGFESRRDAEEAPRQLREEQAVEVAVGILACRLGVGLEAARARLQETASASDITEAQAASVVIIVHRD